MLQVTTSIEMKHRGCKPSAPETKSDEKYHILTCMGNQRRTPI